EEIQHLLEQREPLYREAATIVIQTDDKSVTQIVDEIISALDSPS
ncbi:MAG TPA: shikimate kinase, partial [Gimesia maris]|nr:shikimate kinase [Gimesia maris]